MKFLSILLAATLSTFAPLLRAQISVPGKYRHLVLKSLQKNAEMVQMTEYNMPEQNNAQLLAQAEADEAITPAKLSRKEIHRNSTDGSDEISYGRLPKTAPFTFGKALPLAIDINKAGEGDWIINEETQTKMWRFRVSSKDAHSISIYFDDFHLAPSAELYIIGREDTLGAFTAQNNKENRGFGIAPVAGDFLILEYIESLNRPANSENSSIVVSHVVHSFRPSPFSMKAGTASGNCNINVACPEGSGKNNAINSVALLINGKGDSFCTGAMINNAENDGRQLFLTAEHCIGGSDVRNFMVGFHYQFKYCNSAYETKPQTRTVHGTMLLDKSDVTDYAVLEVVESIPDEWDVYMSGWDATASTHRTGSFYGIHHPSGDTKKVSLYTSQLDLVRLTDMGNGVNFWRVAKWDKGVTEPGSSGSPLFDSNGLIIAHLLGGESSCSHPKSPDYYGALSRDWVLSGNPITKYLNPNNKNLLQVQGAPLKQLRGPSSSETIPNEIAASDASSTAIITVTQTILRTSTITQTIAKSTVYITSRVTITAPGTTSTTTKEVTKTVTTPLTITQTLTLKPPPVTKTVTVLKIKS